MIRSKDNWSLETSHQKQLYKNLINTNFNIMTNWKQIWAAVVKNDNLLYNISPGHIPTGFDLHRCLWCTLNRIRTSHERCADSLHKWDMRNSPECDYGAEKQTVYHIAFRRCQNNTTYLQNVNFSGDTKN